MWLFPWLSYTTIAAMLAVILAMAVLPDTRSQFYLSLVTVVVILAAYEARARRGTNPDEPVGEETGATG
jgi:GABA permease